MTLASRPAHGIGRLRPVPFFLGAALLAAAPVAADPATVYLEWNALREGALQRVAPVLRCQADCTLAFELLTLDDPHQVLRQAGTLRLAPGATRLLGRLVFTPRGSHCRVRLTLRQPDGATTLHLIDPCHLPGQPSLP